MQFQICLEAISLELQFQVFVLFLCFGFLLPGLLLSMFTLLCSYSVLTVVLFFSSLWCTELSGCGTQAQQLHHTGLAASWHVGPRSPTRGLTHAPCTARQILNCQTTQEVPQILSTFHSTAPQDTSQHLNDQTLQAEVLFLS